MIEDLFPPSYICPRPDIVLDQGYDSFIKQLEYKLSVQGRTEIEDITIRCDGKCPKGCEKKFKMKLGKSISEKNFNKMLEHGKKYPEHCISFMYNGVIQT